MLREFVVYCCDKRQLKFVRSKTAVYLDSRHFPVAQPMWDEVLLILFTCGTDQSQHQSAAQEGQQSVDESNELVAFFFCSPGKFRDIWSSTGRPYARQTGQSSERKTERCYSSSHSKHERNGTGGKYSLDGVHSALSSAIGIA